MKLDITDLIKGKENILYIDNNIEFPKEDIISSGMRELQNTVINGTLKKTDDDIYNLNITVNGTMILGCAVSLEDVAYNFSINIDEILSNDYENITNVKIIGNTLDISDIVWENIVLEIPLRVVKRGAKSKTSGEGWSLENSEDVKSSKALQDLKILLDTEGKEK
ncbi:MAG: DUF177 domain-containing protein [Bacilli bacterium]